MYSNRALINTILAGIMSLTAIYLFINFFIFENLILSSAIKNEMSGNCKKAIFAYNLAYPYYKIYHTSKRSKELYLKIPYSLSLCYLKENDKLKSARAISNGLVSIKKEYGVFSIENADYVRKYLIQYHLERNDIKSAEKELENLILIYKNVGGKKDEVADIARIKGDIYYEKKDYITAMQYYKKAYKFIDFGVNTDYETVSKITKKLCLFEIQNQRNAEAITIYKQTKKSFEDYAKDHTELYAQMLIDLAELQRKEDLDVKEATLNYETAISITKTLPKCSYLRQNLLKHMEILKELYVKGNQHAKANELGVEILKMRRFSLN